ncbi:MAG: DUF3305 domain-containing protein [Pseudomonadota bacterium]
MTEKMISMPVGVVVRRTPGATRWAPYAWRAVAVLPGAGPADWRELRREGEAVEYHAGTVEMALHRADTEAYLVALSNDPPTIYAILRENDDPDAAHELVVSAVTASPYEAQDHTDTGEEIVEALPAPPGLIAWIREFVERHHVDDVFVKRRRDRVKTDRVEDGKGDPRIAQAADVYRSPSSVKRRLN